MSRSQLLVPGAVVVAGAFVGLGLYFGLRAPAPPASTSAAAPPASSPPADDDAVIVTPPPRSARPVAPGSSDAIAPPAELSADLQERVNSETVKALATKKPQIVKACWDPSVAASAEPATASFVLRIGYDAAGKAVAFGVGDSADKRRQDVVDCMRKLDLGLTLTPPPGTLVATQLTLKLP